MARVDRLSALDAIFLPMETEAQSLHVGSLLILEGPAPTPAEFRQHVLTRLAEVPMHRRRVLRMPLDLGRPIWVDAQGFDPASHVHHTRLRTGGDADAHADGEADGDEARLRDLVASIMTPRLDPTRPLWELWQVDGLAHGRWAVIGKAHHTMVDGETGADLVLLLLGSSPSTAVALPEPPRLRPSAHARTPSRPSLIVALVEWLALLPWRTARLVVASLWDTGETRRRLDQLRFGVAQLRRPDLPASVLNGPLGPRRCWGWIGADLEAVVRAAHAAGCGLNDVYLAALAGGYRRYLLDRGEHLDGLLLRAIVPVSRRIAGHPLQQGNLASAMFVTLPVQLGEPAARLAALTSQTARQKSLGVAEATAAVVRLADHIPAPLFAYGARAYARAGQRRVNVVASNIRGPAAPQYLAGRRLLELVPYVPTAQEIRTTTAMMTCAGRVTIGITGDADALPDIGRLVTAVGQELHDLAAIGDRRPRSD